MNTENDRCSGCYYIKYENWHYIGVDVCRYCSNRRNLNTPKKLSDTAMTKAIDDFIEDL